MSDRNSLLFSLNNLKPIQLFFSKVDKSQDGKYFQNILNSPNVVSVIFNAKEELLEYFLNNEKLNLTIEEFVNMCKQESFIRFLRSYHVDNILIFLNSIPATYSKERILQILSNTKLVNAIEKSNYEFLGKFFSKDGWGGDFKSVLDLLQISDFISMFETMTVANFDLLVNKWNSPKDLIDVLNKANTKEVDEITSLFKPREDVPGDILNSKVELSEVLKKVEPLDNENGVEKFKKVIDYLSASIFNRLNQINNSYTGRPKNNVKSAQNSLKVNKIQQRKLRQENLLGVAEEMKSRIEGGRKLVIYIRKGHGEMDDYKVSAMTYMLYKYIVLEKRSPIFTDIVITSYKQDIYPKTIHELGIPEDKYHFGRGRDFQNLGLGGNFIFFTHSNSKEQADIFSTPIISQSVIQNPQKYYQDENKFIPLQAFFDIHDVHSPQKYDEYSGKDRGRSLERLLKAMMWSVLCLENQMLREIKNEQTTKSKKSKVAA